MLPNVLRKHCKPLRFRYLLLRNCHLNHLYRLLQAKIENAP
jgi:hypothetical protein